jgi:hypothetical protein
VRSLAKFPWDEAANVLIGAELAGGSFAYEIPEDKRLDPKRSDIKFEKQTIRLQTLSRGHFVACHRTEREMPAQFVLRFSLKTSRLPNTTHTPLPLRAKLDP